jgi:ornithine cyclodeaminase
MALISNWKFRKISLFDLDRREAEISKWLREERHSGEIQDRLKTVRDSSLILSPTASEPYLADEKLLEHAPTVLHLSLRDISVNVILASQNIVDDVDHCLKANTSLHLAEMASGDRGFISGTLVDVLEKKVEPDFSRPRIFSPFGLGVLDIGVGSFVLKEAISSKVAIEIPNFFGSNSTRW